tara:strand:- start:12424 stop:12825 length:402 start_codon:yes stop_codon:yes gene_type:complete
MTETLEYEVEAGHMIDMDTIGEAWTTRFKESEKELAISEFFRLRNGGEYHFVELVERTMEGEDCMFTDRLMLWKFYQPTEKELMKVCDCANDAFNEVVAMEGLEEVLTKEEVPMGHNFVEYSGSYFYKKNLGK